MVYVTGAQSCLLCGATEIIIIGRIAVLRMQIRPIITNRIVWFVGLSVCLSVCHSSRTAKTAEPIEMPFEICTRVGPKKYVLGGMHTGATWRIPLNRPCAAAMRPVVTQGVTLYIVCEYRRR